MTKEPQAETRKFLEETKAKWVVAYVPEALLEAYGVDAYPTAVLVDPTGTILWKGNFPSDMDDSLIEAALRKVRSAMALPGKFSSISSLYDKGKLGEAFQKLEAELKRPALPEAEKKALERARGLIADQAQGDLLEAENLERKEKDFFLALEKFDRAAKDYAGMEASKAAAEAAARIRADASLKPELDGGAKVREAEKKIEAGSYQSGWKILSGVQKSFAGTAAAGKAAALQKKVKDQGYYGFNPSCKDCKKAGQACSECRLSAKW